MILFNIFVEILVSVNILYWKEHFKAAIDVNVNHIFILEIIFTSCFLFNDLTLWLLLSILG